MATVVPSADSLSHAFKRATSAMSRYLANEYKLNPAEIGIVMGTAVRYDIAEVVDPQVHIVAKIPRKALETLPKP